MRDEPPRHHLRRRPVTTSAAAPHPSAADLAAAQRAEIHVGLTDKTLTGLAIRAVHQQSAAKTEPDTKGSA